MSKSSNKPKCANNLPAINPWISCDGTLYTDKEIQYFMDMAIENENYEYAVTCSTELTRRLKNKYEMKIIVKKQ